MKYPHTVLTILGLLFIAFIASAHMPINDNVNISYAPLLSNPKPVVTVGMTNTMTFTPDTVRIEKGQTIKWENTSLLAHSVTADTSLATIDGSAQLPEGSQAFDSGMMDPEQTFKHTFEVPGTYQYFCIPHEGAQMYGWVIVE